MGMKKEEEEEPIYLESDSTAVIRTKKQSTRQTVYLHGDGHILLLSGTAFDLEDEEADRLFVSAHSKGCLNPRQPHPLKVLRFIVRFAFGRNNPVFHLFIKGQHLMNK